MNLYANFEIDLTTQQGLLMANRDRNSFPTICAEIDGYETKVTLTSNHQRMLTPANQTDSLFFFTSASVSVCEKNLTEIPTDGQDIVNFFFPRRENVQQIAHIAINRVLNFFKYSLNSPMIRPFDYIQLISKNGCLSDPTWKYNDTEEQKHSEIIPNQSPVILIEGIGHLNATHLGLKRLKENGDSDLQSFFSTPKEPQLYEELLSDAQTAIFQGNTKRGILELAIACEIFIKQSFFEKNTISGLTYEYLEEQNKVNVRPVDLIHKVAKYVYSSSFKDDHNLDYTNIDHLFRCRNKIAHRGEAIFKDDQATLHQVDHNMICSWWDSFSKLIIWLNNQNEDFASTN
jgi:hypothetical protein